MRLAKVRNGQKIVSRLHRVIHARPEPGTTCNGWLVRSETMDERAGIDRRLDELLVSLAGIVLRLAKPDVIRSVEEYRALAQSVHQYCICAAHSRDPRVQRLKRELEQTLKPRLSDRGESLERFPAKWAPVRVKKTRQNEKPEPPFRFNRNGTGSGQSGPRNVASKTATS
jgi:hypothetical protein